MAFISEVSSLSDIQMTLSKSSGGLNNFITMCFIYLVKIKHEQKELTKVLKFLKDRLFSDLKPFAGNCMTGLVF